MADVQRERERLRGYTRPGDAAGYQVSYETDAPRPVVPPTSDPDAVPAGSSPGNGRSAAARDRSLGSLLKELSSESGTLVRQEVALAKAELAEKAGVMGRNLAAVVVGAVVATAGAMLLLFGLAITLYFGLRAVGLSDWLAGILAFPVFGAVIALVGYVMIRKGLNTLKTTSPVPEQTVQSLKEDKQWLTKHAK
jgi:hypothetical protein